MSRPYPSAYAPTPPNPPQSPPRKRRGGATVRGDAPLPTRLRRRRDAVAIALHHIASKAFHRFLRNGLSPAPRQRGLCGIETREECGAAALARCRKRLGVMNLTQIANPSRESCASKCPTPLSASFLGASSRSGSERGDPLSLATAW